MMLVAFLTFMVLLFAGVPIAFSMGLGSLLGLLVSHNSLMVVGQRLFAGVNSFSLMAIPFFMLSGELMDKGGISRRLVSFAQALVGHITGGLGMVDILTSVIFAGISGSAAADTAGGWIDFDSPHERARLSQRTGSCHSGDCRIPWPHHSSQPDHDHLLLPDESVHQ